ncbi:MAG TPA: response regulator [Polyangia bacterium]|jgi:CheY-like chemotaxis protein|nr:response regulator [Polyangia bacterium]
MNQLSTLLLVDPDPRGLETLTYGFEREGCTVAATSDPKLAQDLLRTTTPQLAVVSLRSPERPGLDVITGIKRGAPVRRVPIVTLGAPGLRQAALAAGANDFVATPLYVRDVINVSRLLTLSHAVPNAPQPETEVQARLSEYHGLFYLLRALAVTGRSGIVLVSRGNKRAELRVSDGAVMAVHVAGLQGLPALHQLLLWEEAALSLKFRTVPRRSNLHMSAQELLDECERFLRDFAHAARDLGAPRCVYVPAAGRDPSASGIQPAQLGPTMRLFDGQRALSDIIEESPFRVFDTVRIVKRLLDAGALAVKSDGLADGAPRSMLEQWAVVPDARGIVGDRKRTSRKLKTVAEASPATAPVAVAAGRTTTPTPVGPIPLTQKKMATVGEIAARKHAPTPAALTALAEAPTVQFKLDELPPASALAPVRSAPITARHATLAPAPAPQVAAPIARPEPAVRAATPAPREHANLRRTPPPEGAKRTPAPSLRDSGSRPSLDALLPSGPDSKNKLRKILPQAHMTPSTAFDAIEADFFAREADLYKQEDVETFDDLDRGGPRPGAPKRR